MYSFAVVEVVESRVYVYSYVMIVMVMMGCIYLYLGGDGSVEERKSIDMLW